MHMHVICDIIGQVEASELLRVFRAYKLQAHKTWTEEQNNKLFASMDTNGDERVDETEFVDFFLQVFCGVVIGIHVRGDGAGVS